VIFSSIPRQINREYHLGERGAIPYQLVVSVAKVNGYTVVGAVLCRYIQPRNTSGKYRTSVRRYGGTRILQRPIKRIEVTRPYFKIPYRAVGAGTNQGYFPFK